MGFGAAIGSYALYIILLLVGLAFFIPGFIMVKRKSRKKKRTTRMSIIRHAKLLDSCLWALVLYAALDSVDLHWSGH